MRTSCLALLFLMGLGTVSCSRRDDRRDEPVARQAGREAARASKEVKEGARQAERDLRNAGKEFREGWNEGKHTDRTEPRK
jgi:hypothetical protein